MVPKLFYAALFVVGSTPTLTHIQVERPSRVRTSEATYLLFKEHVGMESLPFYRLSGHCHSDALLILPFDRSNRWAHIKEIARRSTGDAKHGSLLMIYGIDFKRHKFMLLFSGRLVDFHGAIVGASECPDLLVTAYNPDFVGRATGIGFTRLVFNEQTDVFELSTEEINPQSLGH